MAEFVIGGVKYRTEKVPARPAFHMLRRLSPVIGSFMGITMNKDKVQENIASVVSSLSSIKDEDCDFIINTCLEHVSKEESGHWNRIINQNSKTMQYEIELPLMLTLSARVIVENAQAFMGAVSQMFPEAAEKLRSISSNFQTANPT